MPFIIGQKSVDFIYQKLQNLRKKYKELNINDYKCRIYFFGGEPLLNFKVIKQIVEYAETTYPNCFYYEMVTNGLLLTDEICQFLQKYNFIMKISYDGNHSTERIDKYNQNMNEKIISAIKLLLKYFPEAEVRGTITAKNIIYWFDTFFEYEKLGFQQCSFDFEYFTNWEDKNLKEKIIRELDKFKDYYLYKCYLKEDISLHFPLFDTCINELIRKELTDILDVHDYVKNPLGICNHCGFGLEMISVDYKGDIFPCHESPTADKEYCIGNIGTTIDYKKIQQLQKKLCNYEDVFISQRKCDTEDCLIYKNNIDCEYLSCPMQVLRTSEINKLNCFIKNYCLQIIINISKELFENQNIVYYKYLNNFPYYNILSEIVRQTDPKVKEFLINIYKRQIQL